MDKKHINLINENLSELVEITDNIEQIVEKLTDKKVLNHYMTKCVLKYPDRKRQIAAFYKLIQGRGPTAFNHLVVTLRETKNDRAEQILSSLKVSYFPSSNPVENTNSIPFDDDDLINCNVEDLVVKIHKERKFMDIPENSPCGTYRMRSKPRGLALIINIYKAKGQGDRKGSELDAKKVYKLFSEIGYKVTLYTNLTRKEMKDKIRAFSTNKELATVDSLVVFIMSHGRQHGETEQVELLATDGESLSTNWITEQFTVEYRSSLTYERKPKLFFFQACRVVPQDQKFNFQRRKAQSDSEIVPVKAPRIEDMLIVHSTCTGHPSMRDLNEGAWFVNEFCRILAEHAWQYDLDTMLCMVNEAVRTREDVRHGKQVTDIKKTGISKKIFFNPGL